jgi:hypothetical protein
MMAGIRAVVDCRCDERHNPKQALWISKPAYALADVQGKASKFHQPKRSPTELALVHFLRPISLNERGRHEAASTYAFAILQSDH